MYFSRLIEVLSDFGRTDLQLASVVCKVLMNFSDKIKSCNECFGEEQSNMLISVLYELLDEQLILDYIKTTDLDFQSNERDKEYYIKTLWKDEFCPVARLLLDRLLAHKSQYEKI